jgi:hypothetical protein
MHVRNPSPGIARRSYGVHRSFCTDQRRRASAGARQSPPKQRESVQEVKEKDKKEEK